MRFLFVSLSVLAVSILPCVAASSTALAVAKSQGEFRIDHATVIGNATVLEGSTVETGGTRSDLHLRAGGVVSIQPHSTGRVLADRIVLDKGMANLNHNTGYSVEAQSLRISLENKSAEAQVVLLPSGKVRVAAEGSSAGIRNSQGILVARVMPGSALEFDTQAAPATPQQFQGTGMVTKTDGHYYLTDYTTHVKFELRGEGLDKLVGTRAEVKGSISYAASAGAETPAIVTVASFKILAAAAGAGAAGAGAGAAAGAGAGAAGGAAAAGVAAGLSTGTIAVIGGVAAASVVGGMYGAGVIGGSETPVSKP